YRSATIFFEETLSPSVSVTNHFHFCGFGGFFSGRNISRSVELLEKYEITQSIKTKMRFFIPISSSKCNPIQTYHAKNPWNLMKGRSTTALCLPTVASDPLS